MSRPLLVAATKRQFERFLHEQGKTRDGLEDTDLLIEMRSFMSKYYPGLHFAPFKLVELLASKNVEVSSAWNSAFNSFDSDCESLDFCIGQPLMGKDLKKSLIDINYHNFISYFIGVKDEFRVDGMVDIFQGNLVHKFKNFGQYFNAEFEIIIKKLPDVTQNVDYITAIQLIDEFENNTFFGFALDSWTKMNGKLLFHMDLDFDNTNRTEVPFELDSINYVKISQMKNGLKSYRTLSVNGEIIFQIELDSRENVLAALYLGPYWGREFKDYGIVQNLNIIQYYSSSISSSNRKKRELAITETNSILNELDLLLNPDREEEWQKFQQGTKDAIQKEFHQIDFNAAFESLFEILWYSQMPCFDMQNLTSEYPDQMSVIKRCYWKDTEIPCPLIIQTTSTDYGMCCTFNTEKAENIYKQSRFSTITSTLQKLDKESSFYNQSILPDWYLKREEPKSQAGLSKGLRLVLDAHSDQVSSGTIFLDHAGFLAHIDSKQNFPLTSKQSLLIRPGMETFVTISAEEITTNENTRDISPQRRNCFFPDEHELKIFKNYTQDNCMFECQADYAKGKMNNSCMPWFFPGNSTD